MDDDFNNELHAVALPLIWFIVGFAACGLALMARDFFWR